VLPVIALADADRLAADLVGPLSELADFLGSYVVFSSVEARDAVALWAAHTWAIGAAATTPRLSIRSVEKQSGKTRLLEVLELVVGRPTAAVNVSVAALFRSIGEPPPTILWDEIDALFKGGNDSSREDLRALLNSGYRRGASVLRVVGEGRKMEVKAFATFAPVALAGIGDVPDTVSDRSIIVEQRRRRSDERVRAFRRRVVEPEAEALCDRLRAWAAENLAESERARPAMPDGLSDRAADLWEPLLAIADLAGGSWPSRGRRAAVELARVGREADRSLGVRLLADVRAIWEEIGRPKHIATEELLERLQALDESPWGDLGHGRALDARSLAGRLRKFGARPKQVRLGAVTAKGYVVAELADPWARYLPTTSVQSETTETGKRLEAPELDGPAVSRDQTPPGVSDVSDVSLPGGRGKAEPGVSAEPPPAPPPASNVSPGAAAALRIHRDSQLVRGFPNSAAAHGSWPEADGRIDLLPVGALLGGPDA
jgi:hypothetical protein